MKWQLLKKPLNHKQIVPLLVQFLKPKIYVELGIYRGETFNRCVKALPEEEMAFGADTHLQVGYFRKTKQVKLYQETTNDFFKKWGQEIKIPIDLIFIDADHHKEAAFQDATSFWHYLREDTGLMVLHDTWPLNLEDKAFDKSGDSFLVPKMLKTSFHSSQAEILTLPADSGLTLIRKIGGDWRNG